jgi:hypothetical protein
MNQTSWMAGSIFIGFVVFVTIRGELTLYKDAIFGSGAEKAVQISALDTILAVSKGNL